MKVVNCTKCNEEYAIDLNKPEEWYCPYCDNLYSITTDELSIEKLIEKEIEDYEISYKISGRRSENYIAGILEGLKIARTHLTNSHTTDKLSVEKLQEQLNTAKYFFKNILDVNPNLNKGHVSHLENCVRVMKNSAEKALAAIGGDDGNKD
ncbi:hypothetical protein [Lactococcus lactis]|uniref:hypothetical protein n=1 Tax=Lactococcus lactis TaxID=1358 RepID=UPI001D18E529|nr:hypothetical protein [Lactococcus lactis]MCC4121345.1 hypothetical protein [Lactococcus lactis]